MLLRPRQVTGRDVECELPSLGPRCRRVRGEVLGFGSTWLFPYWLSMVATGVESGKFAGRCSHELPEGTQCGASAFRWTMLSASPAHNLSVVMDRHIPWYGFRRCRRRRCDSVGFDDIVAARWEGQRRVGCNPAVGAKSGKMVRYRPRSQAL